MAFSGVVGFSHLLYLMLFKSNSNLLKISAARVTSICSDFSYLPLRLLDRYLTYRSEIFASVLHLSGPCFALHF